MINSISFTQPPNCIWKLGSVSSTVSTTANKITTDSTLSSTVDVSVLSGKRERDKYCLNDVFIDTFHTAKRDCNNFTRHKTIRIWRNAQGIEENSPPWRGKIIFSKLNFIICNCCFQVYDVAVFPWIWFRSFGVVEWTRPGHFGFS